MSSSIPCILIVGAGGRLGAALLREYSRNLSVIGVTHTELDLADLEQISRLLSPIDFDLLINCAALTAVDYCETHRDEAFRVNAHAPGALAEICRKKGARLVHFSTDYVFDGRQRVPYKEEDVARPLSAYGDSKLAGERNVLQVSKDFLVARVSWVFGPDRPSFVDQVIDRARRTTEVAAIADKISTPTYTMDVARWLEAAWEQKIGGLLHLANEGACSWQEYAQHALDCCTANGMELKTTHVGALALENMSNFVARRPIYTVLSTERFAQTTGVQPRTWRDAVAAYVKGHIVQ